MIPRSAEKITAWHRERRAYVYVRQSTPKQVRENRESQENQYALVAHAHALGWIPERVHVIDADQARLGQDSERAGFRELAAEVSLGRVGLVLAYEASRLARNADWYVLLDLAAVVGVLIADTDGVYDPRDYNDRLLLGLRGMLSQAELHLLRLRLDAGRMRQVERGTYRQHIPTGLVRLPDGRVVKDPNEHIQHSIALVFERFAVDGSAQRVLRSLKTEGVLLPRYQTSGLHAGQLVWKKPTESMVYDILHNPAYAGAFVYGRTGPSPTRRPGQRRQVKRPLEEWQVIRHDVYPAYISWEVYMANRARLADNAYRFAQRTRGAPRNGVALLAGLAVCGRCGHQMQVMYKPQVRYACSALRKSHDADSCLYLEGAGIDEAVVSAFFEALQLAELDLLDEVLAQRRADHARRVQQYAERVAQAEYEAGLARKQYELVDPANRLVAAELERRWEIALRGLAEAKEAHARVAQEEAEQPLDPELRRQLRDLGRQLPALWTSGRLRPEQQKELLRSLIRRVILTRPVPDEVHLKIVWISGAVSPLVIHPRLLHTVTMSTYPQFVARVLALAAEGHLDADIAQILTAEGFRSARSPGVPKHLVFHIRRRHGQPSLFSQCASRAKIGECWTVWGLCRHLGVDRDWLYRRISAGDLPTERHPMTGHYLIKDDPALIARLRDQVAARTPRVLHVVQQHEGGEVDAT
ncbi:MAG: recombinase family protein [Chloroflexota bacterium]